MQVRAAMIAMLAGLSAATAGSAQPLAPGAVPADVTAQVKAAAPALTIKAAELKVRDGRRYYDVEGVLPDGQEMELDLLETPNGWTVVEVQRDIAWAAAPAAARTAAETAWKGPPPVRVIESRQTDGAVIYELFAPGRPATPALEVMVRNGDAKVLSETWPH
jgi:hypothetical protein